MRKKQEIVGMIEKLLDELNEVQKQQAEEEIFESYVKARLEQIEKDVAAIKKSIV